MNNWKNTILIRDILWNIGECELALDFFLNTPNHKNNFLDLTKQEIKQIKNQINYCDETIFSDSKYKNHIEQYKKDRKILVDLINDWCEVFRSNLYIK